MSSEEGIFSSAKTYAKKYGRAFTNIASAPEVTTVETTTTAVTTQTSDSTTADTTGISATQTSDSTTAETTGISATQTSNSTTAETTGISATQTGITTTVTTTIPDGSDDETPSILWGDANLDGKVNVRDCAHIAKALSKGEGDTLPVNADFNQDGKTNVRDAAAIATALARGSDFETTVDDDDVSTVPFADEEELYSDIFRNPQNYSDIWNKFENVKDYIKYFVADIDGDGKKELFIADLSDNNITVNKFVVVNSDLTLCFDSINGGLDIYDNGIISIATSSGGCMIYYDIVNKKHYVVGRETGELSEYGDFEYTNRDTLIKTASGEESDKIINELLVGTRLVPEYEIYNISSPQDFDKLNVFENIEDIRFGWEEAY